MKQRILTAFTLSVLSFGTLLPIPSSVASTKMVFCVNKQTGSMRMLVKGKCKSTEKKYSIDQTIPKNGNDGRNGNSILSGTTDPSSEIGQAGDFYINILTSKFFGPKSNVWPSGISLVGPQGERGGGGTGPAGPSGASDSVLWISSQELKTSRSGDTSALEYITIRDNYLVEALNIASGKERVVFKAVPKGWSRATSITVNVYWVVLTTPAEPVQFSVYLGSRGNGEDLTNSAWGFGTLSDDAIVRSAKVLNVDSFVWPHDKDTAVRTIEDGEIFNLSLYRSNSAGYFTGNVYVLGVSIEANF